jgi:protoheme IX farnesyltransferase
MTSNWFYRCAWLLVGATFLLIIAGASVTSNRAGLSVPDWPETYSHPMWRFPLEFMRGGIFYEHTHRLIASAVGLLTAALSLWAFAKGDRLVRRLGLAALAVVLLQGLLGGLTVKFLLPPAVSIAHAALAQAFFCITIALALSNTRPVESTGTIRGLGLATTIAVYIQLILGASIRHSERGVIAHIAGAVGVLTLAVLLVRYRRSLLALVTAQIGLGIAALVVRQPKLASGQLDAIQIVLPTLHLAVGALILGVCFALTYRLGIRWTAPLGAFLELTKPRIVTMVLVTTALGYFLGGHAAWIGLLATLAGVGLATGGAAALNNYLDRDVDAKMSRTCQRVLPAGVVAPAHALAYGVSLVLVGVLALVWWVNLLTGFLVLLAAFLYVLVYTPMKRVSWFNTTVGAIPGAIPPLCGWAAATGQLAPGAWVLFAILFVWQHPHFFSIAWMFKDDYRRAGLKMLSVVDPAGTFRQTILFSIALIGVAVLPTFVGMAGRVYLVGAVVLSVAMLAVGIWFCRQQSFTDARRLLKASVLYLPLLVALMIVDKL